MSRKKKTPTPRKTARKTTVGPTVREPARDIPVAYDVDVVVGGGGVGGRHPSLRPFARAVAQPRRLVGVQALGPHAIGVSNLGIRGAPRRAQNAVWVFGWSATRVPDPQERSYNGRVLATSIQRAGRAAAMNVIADI